MPYSVYVVEDHPIFLEGLRGILDREVEFELVGCAPNSATARNEIPERKPDLLVVDLGLPDGSGLDLIEFALTIRPKQTILVVSGLDKSLYAFRALRTGAQGYLSKEMSASNVIEAFRTVLRGDVYLDHDLKQSMLAESVGHTGRSSNPLNTLTDRELDVYRLIGRGQTIQEIADSLFLSPKTVETYRANIKRKLGLANSRELIRESTRWCLEEARPNPTTKSAA